MIAQKMSYRQQKRTESPFGAIDIPQIVLLDDAREKLLRTVLGFIGVEPFAPDEAIDRMPVTRAQASKRLAGEFGFGVAGLHYHAPSSGWES
jgi:hypothetical protein